MAVSQILYLIFDIFDALNSHSGFFASACVAEAVCLAEGLVWMVYENSTT